MYLRQKIGFLALTSLLALTSAAVCPPACVCSTTPDGLHRAACSSVADLFKFTLQRKHHNINILDLSHNNITKLTHELDRLTEVVTLDLSTNGITEVDKFLHNAQKIVHLNLAHNRIQKLSFKTLPKSLSSLDLSHNLLKDVPANIDNLKHLEHLELNENPLDCTCENLVARDILVKKGVLIDHVKCQSPAKYKETSWLELKTKDVCDGKMHYADAKKVLSDDLDVSKVGRETNELKKMPLQAARDLDEGETWERIESKKEDDYDEVLFVEEKKPKLIVLNQIEGSGDDSTQTEREENILTTEMSLLSEGSGYEGSGDGGIGDLLRGKENENSEATTPEIPATIPDLFHTPIIDGITIPAEIEPPKPTIYQGSEDWVKQRATESTEKPVFQDTTVSEKIQITQSAGIPASSQENPTPTHKTGTYVCIAIIVVLLVGLVAFAIIKGQMRKQRDKRLLRQQRRDVEKASKEMVDMNKALLGKPAPKIIPTDKKMNGKYEMVPTHESQAKKTENGNLGSSTHEDLDKHKSSPTDNNQNREMKSPEVFDNEICSNGTAPNDNRRKDINSLTSEEFAPNLSGSQTNGIDGDQNSDSDFLSPSREYTPVYTDLGRVRIKMSETPKPKTPVLVTRSRSNAGDIVIIPAAENIRKNVT